MPQIGELRGSRRQAGARELFVYRRVSISGGSIFKRSAAGRSPLIDRSPIAETGLTISVKMDDDEGWQHPRCRSNWTPVAGHRSVQNKWSSLHHRLITRTIIAIPFPHMHIHRPASKPLIAAKWVTKIYYPVMYKRNSLLR